MIIISCHNITDKPYLDVLLYRMFTYPSVCKYHMTQTRTDMFVGVYSYATGDMMTV